MLKQPVFLILDSYPVQEKVAKDVNDDLVKLIPACMTGMLQPLDVAVNRSLQVYYNVKYDEYMNKAFVDTSLQTKNGNIKSPSYKDASLWIAEWTRTKEDNSLDY